MDAAERALLEETVRSAIVSTDGAAANVDTALSELGWLEMLRHEPRATVPIVFEALGTTNAIASVLDDVLAAALGLEPSSQLAVLLPTFTTADPAGTIEGTRVTATGLSGARLDAASEIVVVARSGTRLAIARVPAASVESAPIDGVDPAFALRRVEIDTNASAVEVEPDAWETLVSAGRVAIAHQLRGASRSMLDLARAHALERIQFDRPIARFQAVRHRLADALVAIEALDAGLITAADAPGPLTAALAKALAGRAARTTAAHCQQVLAGIGFTTDHPFHRFFKRALVLDGLLGSTEAVTLSLGRHLLTHRAVPTLIEL